MSRVPKPRWTLRRRALLRVLLVRAYLTADWMHGGWLRLYSVGAVTRRYWLRLGFYPRSGSPAHYGLRPRRNLDSSGYSVAGFQWSWHPGHCWHNGWGPFVVSVGLNSAIGAPLVRKRWPRRR